MSARARAPDRCRPGQSKLRAACLHSCVEQCCWPLLCQVCAQATFLLVDLTTTRICSKSFCPSRKAFAIWTSFTRTLYAGSQSAAFAAESQGYVPSPVTVGWEIYAGAIAGVIPFAIGSYQFIARIVSFSWPVYAFCSSDYMGCNCALLAKLWQRPVMSFILFCLVCL